MMRWFVMLFSALFVFSLVAPSISFAEEKKDDTSNATQNATKEEAPKKKKKEVGC